MPGLVQEDQMSEQLDIRPLHPTFGAEINGLNLTNISDGAFEQIMAAMAKARILIGYTFNYN